MNDTVILPRNVALSRLGVLSFYYSLIGFFVISTPLMLGVLSLGNTAISFIQVFPLLLFARGLQTTRARTYGWMSFVVLLYFIHGVLVAFRAEQLIQGLIEVGLCTGLFVALVLFIRSYREHFKTPL